MRLWAPIPGLCRAIQKPCCGRYQHRCAYAGPEYLPRLRLSASLGSGPPLRRWIFRFGFDVDRPPAYSPRLDSTGRTGGLESDVSSWHATYMRGDTTCGTSPAKKGPYLAPNGR